MGAALAATGSMRHRSKQSSFFIGISPFLISRFVIDRVALVQEPRNAQRGSVALPHGAAA